MEDYNIVMRTISYFTIAIAIFVISLTFSQYMISFTSIMEAEHYQTCVPEKE
jgi:hypothetical protein